MAGVRKVLVPQFLRSEPKFLPFSFQIPAMAVQNCKSSPASWSTSAQSQMSMRQSTEGLSNGSSSKPPEASKSKSEKAFFQANFWDQKTVWFLCRTVFSRSLRRSTRRILRIPAIGKPRQTGPIRPIFTLWLLH